MKLIYRETPKNIEYFAACVFAVLYIWFLSETAYFQTGLQFIAPILVIFSIHLLFMWRRSEFTSGYSVELFRRGAVSALCLGVTVFAASLIAPLPTNAGMGEITGMALLAIVCLLVVVVVAGVIGWIIWMIAKLIHRLIFGKSDQESPNSDTRLFDAASVVLVFTFLSGASLEGLPKGYDFQSSNQARASQMIDADATKVWAALGTATSPSFALPKILRAIPQPVAVEVDEGVGLGAKRRVRFSGREGVGHLDLRVIKRTAEIARFEVVSDTSPIKDWVAHRAISYRVIPIGDQTKLVVTHEFDRLLAPAWFFNSAIKGAGFLAMNVLARDVKARSEMTQADG